MEKVLVKIEGIGGGLLQHRFPEDTSKVGKAGKAVKEYDDKKECEKALYVDEAGKIYQPATHILGCLINAGKQFQFKKQATYGAVIKSSLIVTPDAIPHLIPKWVIDRKPVVIMRARIMRARPLFPKWALEFTLEYDEELISKEKLKEMLDFAGQRVGIGDYRPLYGRFIVTKFQELK